MHHGIDSASFIKVNDMMAATRAKFSQIRSFFAYFIK